MTNHPFCCHTAVTPSFLHHHSTPLSKICCHTTITLLSHYYHRSHFFSKNQLLPQRISSFPRKSPMLSRKCPIFSRKSPTFPRKSPSFSRKSGTSLKRVLTLVAHPCDRCDRKNKKLLVYTRARRDRFTPKDKTSRPFAPFRKLVMAISATPEEKSAVFHQ